MRRVTAHAGARRPTRGRGVGRRRHAAEDLGTASARRIAGTCRPRACSSGNEARGARCRNNGPGTRNFGRFHVVAASADGAWELEERAMKKSGRAGRHSVYNDPDPAGKTAIQNYTKAIS